MVIILEKLIKFVFFFYTFSSLYSSCSLFLLFTLLQRFSALSRSFKCFIVLFSFIYRETLEDLLSRAKDSLLTSLEGCLLGDCATSSAAYLMQLKSLTAIRETLLAVDTEQVCKSLPNVFYA